MMAVVLLLPTSLQPLIDGLPPAALPGAKLLKKFDQNF
jgi:hypothetical protein